MWEAIQFFSTSAIEKDTGTAKGQKKPRPKPQPPLFEVCESLFQLASDYALAHRLSFLQWAPAEMGRRKQTAKQQSYDDLIGRLAGALKEGSGEALANAVRGQYQAALIDEFQDTDPQQWEIFRRIFGESPSHWLFLIGDPKQAIYGFRGADVSTYVQAAASAHAKHELDTNWRSESGLVRALNTVFTHAGKQSVFLEKGINFEEVKPSEKADREPFTIDAKRPPPLQVWCWESAKGPVGAGEARKQLPVSVAAEVSRLLSDRSCCLNRRRLQPRDIAVLVESHDQASRIKSALQSLSIPAVELAQQSVLETEEARELQWILMGVLEPGREHLVKSALTTDTLGWTADRLLKESSEEKTWQPCLQRFVGYREAWEKEGFFYMFSSLLRHEAVFANLLRFADGERRITNLLHLAERLEIASQTQHLGPLRLLQWLEARRLSEEAAAEEYQLRLESDEDAVNIVTIHSAKGLEYPVVFCPFFQKDASLKPIKGDNGSHAIKAVVLCHDAEIGRMTWDLSPEPAPANVRRAGGELGLVVQCGRG
jgi:exodeoxyribonuclease V beta subunit